MTEEICAHCVHLEINGEPQSGMKYRCGLQDAQTGAYYYVYLDDWCREFKREVVAQ